MAKFFAHLLFADGIEWSVLRCVRLTEDDTNSSSRIFIKIVFQELVEMCGMVRLRERLAEEPLQEHLTGVFPRDNVRNARFSINFFTSIGLGAITEESREFLKNAPKILLQRKLAELEDESSSESDSSSSDGGSGSSSSSD